MTPLRELAGLIARHAAASPLGAWESESLGLRVANADRIPEPTRRVYEPAFALVALMSPLRYLKQIRLQEARARLLARADDVAAVGYAVGYDSPSQFSREYKRAYGVPPGQDARLLRAAQPASK